MGILIYRANQADENLIELKTTQFDSLFDSTTETEDWFDNATSPNLQGISYSNEHYELALTDWYMQVKSCLNIVLETLDWEFWCAYFDKKKK